MIQMKLYTVSLSVLVWDLLGVGGWGWGLCSKAKDKKFLRIYWMYMVIKEHDLFTW